jgi:hypothetical protein
MTADPLCITCGYWTATIGDQCDTCRGGDPEAGLQAAIVAAAITWRRALTDPWMPPAIRNTLVDAVDRLLEGGW